MARYGDRNDKIRCVLLDRANKALKLSTTVNLGL
jgi:hypothetical protein